MECASTQTCCGFSSLTLSLKKKMNHFSVIWWREWEKKILMSQKKKKKDEKKMRKCVRRLCEWGLKKGLFSSAWCLPDAKQEEDTKIN